LPQDNRIEEKEVSLLSISWLKLGRRGSSSPSTRLDRIGKEGILLSLYSVAPNRKRDLPSPYSVRPNREEGIPSSSSVRSDQIEEQEDPPPFLFGRTEYSRKGDLPHPLLKKFR